MEPASGAAPRGQPFPLWSDTEIRRKWLTLLVSRAALIRSFPSLKHRELAHGVLEEEETFQEGAGQSADISRGVCEEMTGFPVPND